ncbi:MAG: DUF883 family protein [Zoogloeaceae bacterium]|jgi:ElaB/YqjD/DUF883 family membrane-anchored ribosome-binding protein|nr:DUF883 family protein [Zoogloeaceae bacterium]
MSEAITTNSTEKLTADLKAVRTDLEDIARSIADVAGEKAAGVRARVEAKLKDVKVRLEDIETIMVDKTRACARATDDFVHDNPWKAVGVASLIGLALGVLIGRR